MGGKGNVPAEKVMLTARTLEIIVGGSMDIAPQADVTTDAVVDEAAVMGEGGGEAAPLGIDSHDAARVTAYPNPTNDELHVRMEGLHGQTTLQLVDAQGRVVRKHSAELEGTEDIWTFSVRDLSEGIYFLNVRNSSAVMTKKIVVTRR